MIPVKVHSVATDASEDRFFAVLASEGQTEERWLPVQIGASEAVSIASELNEEGTERPGTHDLITETIDRLGVTVDRIVIERGDEDVEATLYMNGDEDGEMSFDARPSDALAVGVRTNAELTVSEQLMQRASRSSEYFEDQFANAHPSSEVTQLQYELEQAIEEEDFERAAELKQEIQSAARRYEESTDLSEEIEEELENAYRGSESEAEAEE